MIRATFPHFIDDDLLLFVVIVAKKDGQFIFCRHEQRQTWEVPGGHREPGETLEQAAKRELYEETGALEFSLIPVCPYGFDRDGDVSYGMVYAAEVTKLGPLPESEIAEIRLADNCPGEWTYKEVQPALMERALLKLSGEFPTAPKP